MSVVTIDGPVFGQPSGRREGAKSPQRLRLTRRGRRVFGALIAVPIVVVLGLAGLWSSGAVAGDQQPAQFHYVTVYAGDTLWDIAAEATASGGDVRDTMAEIVSLNSLSSSSVQPGQKLALPLSE